MIGGKNTGRILTLMIGLYLIPKIFDTQSIVEESNIIDIPFDNSNINQGNDDLIPSFCVLNPANGAGTNNFNLSEFHSKDGTLVPFSVRGNIQVLMDQLEVIRRAIGAPIIISSGYRSPEHNRNVGGTADSKHLCGMAADFYSPGIPNDLIQEEIDRLIAEGKIINGGLGRYNTFTHYDIGTSRRWDKRNLA